MPGLRTGDQPRWSSAGARTRSWIGENQISLTDPDSRAMAAHTHVAVGYKCRPSRHGQIASHSNL